MPTDVLIANIAVLFAVIPLFVVHPATAGHGEVLEIALAALGALLGIAAAAGLMKISFDASSAQAVSTAGVAYGVFWAVVIGARLLFILGRSSSLRVGHRRAPDGATLI